MNSRDIAKHFYCIAACAFLLPWFHIPLIQPVAASPCVEPEEFQDRWFFKNEGDGQIISCHDLGIVKLDLILETSNLNDSRSKKFKDNVFLLEVNGRKTPYAAVGGGHSTLEGGYRLMKTIAFRPGPKAGKKRIRAVTDESHAEIALDYQPKGQIVFCQVFDKLAVLGREEYEIHWLGYYLNRKSIILNMNGEPAPFECQGSAFDPELLQGKIVNNFRPGKNIISFQAEDLSGETLDVQKIVFYYPGNTIRTGDRFLLRLGPLGSKMGPFYRARVLDGALSVLSPGPHHSVPAQEETLNRITEGGLIAERERPVVSEFEAVRPGESIIMIEKKRNFREGKWELHKKIYITVE